MSRITLDQNIPTEVWGVHLVATNVVDGDETTLRVTVPGSCVEPRRVRVGETVEIAGSRVTVERVEGGGHDGPPGRSSGRVTLARADGED